MQTLSQNKDRARERKKEKEMNVELVKEHEDGSATYLFDLTAEEKTILLNFAIITALKNSITEGEKYSDDLDID
jgi:hypothetical protein